MECGVGVGHGGPKGKGGQSQLSLEFYRMVAVSPGLKHWVLRNGMGVSQSSFGATPRVIKQLSWFIRHSKYKLASTDIDQVLGGISASHSKGANGPSLLFTTPLPVA